MTMPPPQQPQNPATGELPPLIPPGYALARLMAKDRNKAIKAVQRASDRFINETHKKLETMQAAFGIKRQANPMRRLAAYLQKPDEVWQEQRAKFPDDYEKDWDDFQKLRERAQNGDFQDRQ